MPAINNLNLAIKNTEVLVPRDSFLGATSSVVIGLMLVIGAVVCIKGRKKTKTPMLIWGPKFTAFMDEKVIKKRFDWKSLVTFFIGFAAITCILGGPAGTVHDLAVWFQDLVVDVGDWTILSDIGAVGFCGLFLLLAMRNEDDNLADLSYGSLCGLVFPLGGGAWAGLSQGFADFITSCLSGGAVG